MAIVIEQLTHDYTDGAGNYRALHNISLTVEPGEFVSIIGHTGSGKTTLVQHLNGLLLPTEGSVTVDGFDTRDKAQRKSARALVGMVFQYPEYQLFDETVLKDVAFGPKNLGRSEEEATECAREAMRLVGLDPERFAEKSPFDLSGGEKRRAALAGILAMHPKYLVLDEPMAGLDPHGRGEILDLIENLRQTEGSAILMVSHSMDDVAKYATRVLVMAKRTLVMDDTPEAVFSRAGELFSFGLDVPQATQIALLLRKKGLDIPASICREGALTDALIRRYSHDG